MSHPPTRRFAWTVPDAPAMAHIALPFDPVAAFGRVRAPVAVTVAAHRYRSTIAVMRGEVFVPLRRSHREAAGIAPGEVVEVTLTLDTAPREVAIPADLAAALAREDLTDAWSALSITRRREHVEAIAGGRRPETRARRLAAAIEAARVHAATRTPS